ncbi:MAG: hypothetical protein K5666_05105 [Bacilli bacterium]|nr:hypothetical protein [Bacilli bacterium]
MQSRMDRYNNIDSDNTNIKSRTKKNQDLYEKIKSSDIRRYDVNNNMSVIDDNIKSVDINKIHNFLDEKYGDNTAKRRSIDLPEINEKIEQDPIMDTKEYDINAIIEKAKQGKNIDYSKERLKKVREAQFEILNNLDSEIENLSSLDRAKEKRKQQEEELKHLINTITEIELQNKMKETQSDLDLLSDLMEDPKEEDKANTSSEDILKDIEKTLEQTIEQDEIDADTTPDIVIGGVQHEEDTVNSKIIDEQKQFEKDKKELEKKKDEQLEKTLEKLNIDSSSYEEFDDINKRDKSSIILRTCIILIVAALLFGAVVLLNYLLGLDILPF